MAADLIAFDHSLTTRGYTGHEMLDEVGLIHMNGRVYDPKLARFLQADPFIQDPTNSQSLNRYSYVWNNPLNATDPSGYFVFTLIAAAIVAADIGLKIHAVVALFAVAGFADTLLAGGSFKDALLAGISAGAFAALGAHLGGFTGFGDAVGDVMAMGVLGGVTTVLQGGKFGHGFRSAGLSSLTGGLAGKVSQKLKLRELGQGIARMVAAGTTSELTGGKFANGAASAAFSAVARGVGESIGKAAEGPELDGKSEAEVLDDVMELAKAGKLGFEVPHGYSYTHKDIMKARKCFLGGCTYWNIEDPDDPDRVFALTTKSSNSTVYLRGSASSMTMSGYFARPEDPTNPFVHPSYHLSAHERAAVVIGHEIDGHLIHQLDGFHPQEDVARFYGLEALRNYRNYVDGD